MFHPTRRAPRRTRNLVRPATRLRPGGLDVLTGAAIVGALAFAVSADRLGSPVRVAAVGTARSASPTVAATVPDVPWLAQLPDGEWVHGHGGRGDATSPADGRDRPCRLGAMGGVASCRARTAARPSGSGTAPADALGGR